jgi:hypothetical protein
MFFATESAEDTEIIEDQIKLLNSLCSLWLSHIFIRTSIMI